MISNEDVLNSWKEVASYLGRGVRTVQRWEQELSLPVRRPRGKSRSAVIAFKTELDVWLHQSQTNLAVMETDSTIVTIPLVEPQLTSHSEKLACLAAARLRRSELHDHTAVLIAKMEQLLSRSNGLCARSKSLSEQVNNMVTLTAYSLDHAGGAEEQRNKKRRQTMANANGELNIA